jgi:hypothetical protein
MNDSASALLEQQRAVVRFLSVYFCSKVDFPRHLCLHFTRQERIFQDHARRTFNAHQVRHAVSLVAQLFLGLLDSLS